MTIFETRMGTITVDGDVATRSDGKELPLTPELLVSIQAAHDDYAQERIKVSNKKTIIVGAAQALAANSEFLALTSPTNAQSVAQVKALTRQVNALIRILIDALDTTDGT
jgi:hypothetical protein